MSKENSFITDQSQLVSKLLLKKLRFDLNLYFFTGIYDSVNTQKI